MNILKNLTLFNKNSEKNKEFSSGLVDQYVEIAKIVKEARINQNIILDQIKENDESFQLGLSLDPSMKDILLFTDYITVNDVAEKKKEQPILNLLPSYSWIYGTSEYHLHKDSKTWEEAKSVAEGLGGKLVELETEEENKNLFENISKYISSKDFLESIKYRAKGLGRQSNCQYAEGFIAYQLSKIQSIFDFK